MQWLARMVIGNRKNRVEDTDKAWWIGTVPAMTRYSLDDCQQKLCYEVTSISCLLRIEKVKGSTLVDFHRPQVKL